MNDKADDGPAVAQVSDNELEQITARVYQAGVASGLSELDRAIGAHRPNGSAARSLAVAAGARLVRYKLGQRVSDLQDALTGYERAHALEPTASRAANIAAALLELNDVPDPDLVTARATRHAQALGLLRWSLAQTEQESDSWVTRSTTLTGALLDGVVHGFPDADVGKLLESAATTAAGAGQDPARAAEPNSLLGSAHLVAADLGHAGADLDTAVEALRLSVALTPEGHIDRPARMANLAAALVDRYERSGDEHDLREAVEQQRQAADLLDPADARRGQFVNNMANALRAVHQVTGTHEDLLACRAVLDDLVAAFTPADPYFATARSNAGLIAVDAATILDDDVLLDAGIRFHVEAVQATPSGHPQRPGRLSSLAVGLMRRYDRKHDPSDLEAALEIGDDVLSGMDGPTHEQAIFLSTQGSARHEVFLRKGHVRDLEESTQLHRAALDGLPRSSPFAASMLNNAAVALSDRYERLGESADLDAALNALRESVALSGDLVGADLVGRLNNLVLALLRHADLTLDDEAADHAVTLAERAVAEAGNPVADVPVSAQLVAWGTLLDALRRAADSADTPEALATLRGRSRQAWSSVMDLIEQARPASRGVWLLRAAFRRDPIPSGAHRRHLLMATIETSREGRPHVALSAARQLAMDSLLEQAGERGDGDDVEIAAAVVDHLSRQFRTGQEHLRHALSWQSEVTGFWSTVAQSRLMGGDPDGAARAHEEGHAVLMSDTLTTSPSLPTLPTDTVVTVWATPVGGAALVRRREADAVHVDLPDLTSQRAAQWVRLLRKASQLGQGVLERTLRRVREELGPAVTIPITHQLQPGEPLVWAAAGAVALLPVGCAATASGQPLAATHVVRTSPTARIAAWAEQQATARSGSVGPTAGPWVSFAAPTPSRYPPLAEAAAESGLFADDGHTYLADDCTREAVLDNLGGAGMIHFALHARLTARDPLMNHLVLSEDLPVFAQDVIGLQVPARLAVLSACDTAAPGVAHADEGLGLAGAFLAAGVPGVIASLWSVGDRGASVCMQDVARALRDGARPAAALSQAAMRAQATGAPDTDWAGFVLLGA